MDVLKRHLDIKKIPFTQNIVNDFKLFCVNKKIRNINDDVVNDFLNIKRNPVQRVMKKEEFGLLTELNTRKQEKQFNPLPYTTKSDQPIFNQISKDVFNVSTVEHVIHTLSSLPSPYDKISYSNIQEFPLLNVITAKQYKYIIIHEIVIPQFTNYNDNIFANFSDFKELRFTMNDDVIKDFPHNGIILKNNLNNIFTAGDVKLQPIYGNQQSLSKITVTYKDRMLRPLNLPPANLPPIYSIYLNTTRDIIFFTFADEHYSVSSDQISFYFDKQIITNEINQINSINVGLYYSLPNNTNKIKVYDRDYLPVIDYFLKYNNSYPVIRLSETLVSFETPVSLPYLCKYIAKIEFISFYNFYYFITQNKIRIAGNPYTYLNEIISYTENGKTWEYDENSKEIITTDIGDANDAIKENNGEWGFYLNDFTTHTVSLIDSLELTMGSLSIISNNIEANHLFLGNLYMQNRLKSSYLKISVGF